MTYLLQSKKNTSRKFAPLIVVGIFIFIVVVMSSISSTFFGRIANSVGLPFWHSGGFLFDKVSTLKAFTSSRYKILEEKRDLKLELSEANTRLLSFSVVEKENEDLKKSLGRESEGHGILAYVLVKPPQTFYDTLILDVGQDKKINKGNKLFVSNTVVLGIIDEVFSKTSRAKLFSSANIETVGIVDRNNLSVTLIGKGGGNFEIQAPQELDIVTGDMIVFPGTKHGIMADVFDIEVIPSKSFKRVFCKVPVNIDELRFVSLVE